MLKSDKISFCPSDVCFVLFCLNWNCESCVVSDMDYQPWDNTGNHVHVHDVS